MSGRCGENHNWLHCRSICRDCGSDENIIGKLEQQLATLKAENLLLTENQKHTKSCDDRYSELKAENDELKANYERVLKDGKVLVQYQKDIVNRLKAENEKLKLAMEAVMEKHDGIVLDYETSWKAQVKELQSTLATARGLIVRAHAFINGDSDFDEQIFNDSLFDFIQENP